MALLAASLVTFILRVMSWFNVPQSIGGFSRPILAALHRTPERRYGVGELWMGSCKVWTGLELKKGSPNNIA